MSSRKLNVNIMRLISTGLEPEQVAIELKIPQDYVKKIITRDKSRVRDDPRSKDCLAMYRDGYTYGEIGQKYKITRERVRQIIKKQVGFEMDCGPLEQEARKSEIDIAARNAVVISREDRQGDIVDEKIAAAEAKGIEAEYFDSVRKYCAAIGVNIDMFKKSKPDIYKLVRQNETRKVSRWSWYYDECRTCGTTTIKHQGYGYCKQCYSKSSEFKNIVKRSHLKNREARLAANKKYAEDYYSRPEVIEKMEREYDEKYFGGNRKKALERDEYKCITCGMTLNEKDISGKPKVRVWHLDSTEDHSLENLGTYDQSCFIKKYGSNGKFRLKRRS